jgi:hypothetical protein
VSSEKKYEEAMAHLDRRNRVMASFEFRNAAVLGLNEGNLDVAAKAVMMMADCDRDLGMPDRAKQGFTLACRLAEAAGLNALTCCQVWAGSSWGLAHHLEDFAAGHAWLKKADEMAKFAGLDRMNLPRETKRTPAPNLKNPETQKVIAEIAAYV